MGDETMTATSPSEMIDEINLKESFTIYNTSQDDDVVVRVDEEFLDSKISNSTTNRSPNPFSEDYEANENTSASDADFFRFKSTGNEGLFADRPNPEWVGWGEPVGGSGVNPFEDDINIPKVDIPSAPETPVGVGLSFSPCSTSLPNGSSSDGSMVSSDTSQIDGAMPSLFEEDVEFVGVEVDGSEKAMDKALEEGIVGEAGALKRKVTPSGGEN